MDDYDAHDFRAPVFRDSGNCHGHYTAGCIRARCSESRLPHPRGSESRPSTTSPVRSRSQGQGAKIIQTPAQRTQFSLPRSLPPHNLRLSPSLNLRHTSNQIRQINKKEEPLRLATRPPPIPTSASSNPWRFACHDPNDPRLSSRLRQSHAGVRHLLPPQIRRPSDAHHRPLARRGARPRRPRARVAPPLRALLFPTALPQIAQPPLSVAAHLAAASRLSLPSIAHLRLRFVHPPDALQGPPVAPGPPQRLRPCRGHSTA